MSQPDLKEAMRDALAGLFDEDRSLGEMVDMAPKLAEFIRPYAAPDFECRMAGLPPTPPVSYPGVDGIVRAWQDFGHTFRSVRAELDRIVETDQALVLLVSQTAVTAHGGVEMSQPGALVVAIEGDHVSNVQFHLDQTEALRAGGVPGP
jgi:hypothetical protein